MGFSDTRRGFVKALLGMVSIAAISRFSYLQNARSVESWFGEDDFLEIRGWVIHISQLNADQNRADFPQ